MSLPLGRGLPLDMIKIRFLRTIHRHFKNFLNSDLLFLSGSQPEHSVWNEVSSLTPFSLQQEEKRGASRRRALCRPPWMLPSNALYPSRQKCRETWETYIFNTAFLNLITSAIRLCCHENELADGSAASPCSVWRETLLRVGIKFHQFFRLWRLCGQCLRPCQRVCVCVCLLCIDRYIYIACQRLYFYFSSLGFFKINCLAPTSMTL